MIHLSFDQDWAPAWATLDLYERVVRSGKRGTFFVTHDCPTLPTLRSGSAFELGWHPNFLPGSSHGGDMAAVLDTMERLVPEAQGARAHCLLRGTPILRAYAERGLRYDASDLHDDVPNQAPFVSWTGLVRLPIFFEDDVHLERRRPCTLEALGLERPGLKVFNFHPVLVALNAADPSVYAALKAQLAEVGRPLTEATREDFAACRQTGGVSDLLDQLLAYLQDHPEEAGGTLTELADAVQPCTK